MKKYKKYKKPNENSKKIKIIIAIVLVCALILTGVVLFFTTDIFRTKRSGFIKYLQQIPASFDVLKMPEFNTYKNTKETVPYSRKAEMTIQSSANIANNNILDKVRFSMNQKVNNPKQLAEANISIRNENNELTSISLLREKLIYGFSCPLISEGYINIRNQNLGKLQTPLRVDYLPNDIKIPDFSDILEFDKNEQKHIEQYFKVIENDVPDTSYTREDKKIKIDGEEYSTKLYTLELDSTANANLQTTLLEKLSKDSVMLDCLASRFSLLGFEEKYTTVNRLNETIQERIKSIKSKPSSVKDLKIKVYENKMKNIKTEIQSANNKLVIEHVTKDGFEKLRIQYNSNEFYIIKEGNTYKFYVGYKDENNLVKSIEIKYNQNGTVGDNNVENIAEITKKDGIKSITYSYKDKVTFTNNIGTIKLLSNNKGFVLNDVSTSDATIFINALKEKINRSYVSKGAEIGINLDPIFE